MTDTEKRRIILIIGASTAFFVLVTAAVIFLDVPALMNAVVAHLQPGFQPIDYDPDTISPEEFRLPRNVALRGPIERDQIVTGTIGFMHTEGWTLAGRARDTYLLDFDPLSGSYIWQMEVYGPDQQLFALTADSDAGYADFTLLEIKLPRDGTYTIVLSAVGEDGKYRLTIR